MYHNPKKPGKVFKTKKEALAVPKPKPTPKPKVDEDDSKATD